MPEIVEIPIELTHFQLPQAVQARLQFLLDRQDEGNTLSLKQNDRKQKDLWNWQNFYLCCVCDRQE
ncbi:hypothetical protein [Floridanema evergladense]|uniref:Uncharacterized protein n=1 Tax=Floridaenema evergladense BLCC-F167 TaxID=3153639 RepID=A0ABV4WWT1_9CYAN